MKNLIAVSAFLYSLAWAAAPASADAGAEGASFLYIPVGARAAALGGAYGPLATDSYASAWNPAGLGRLERAEVSATYLSYVEQVSYQNLSLAMPAGKGGFGASIQYLDPGKLKETDAAGNRIGDFSGYFAVAAVSYGLPIGDNLSLGLSAKTIQGDIAGMKASTPAGDIGLLFRAGRSTTLSAVAANIGAKLKFIDQNDPLASSYRLGLAQKLSGRLTLALEGVSPQSGDTELHSGLDWKVADGFSLRGGYQTHAAKDLSGAAGITAGLGARWENLLLDYAFVPLGDLGQTHHVSLGVSWGGAR